MTETSSWTYMPSFEGDRILERLFAVEHNDLQYLMDPPSSLEPGSTVLHISCNTSSIPHMAYLAQRVLEALEIPFISLGGPENCCGAVQWAFEDEMRARQVATLTLGGFRRVKPVRVVSTCPDCDMIFSLYKGKQYKFQQSNMLEVFAENRDRLAPLLKHEVNRRVILHAHDENPQRQADARALRQILELIPGLEIVEAESAGGLGNHCMVKTGRFDGTMFESVVKKMFDEAKALGADALIVPYHGCYRQNIKHQIRFGVEIFHYLTLIAQSIGIPYRERFKEIRLLDDIDAAFQELKPRADELGISSEELRTALEHKVYV